MYNVMVAIRRTHYTYNMLIYTNIPHSNGNVHTVIHYYPQLSILHYPSSTIHPQYTYYTLIIIIIPLYTIHRGNHYLLTNT
jgi:hypothetical protein